MTCLQGGQHCHMFDVSHKIMTGKVEIWWSTSIFFFCDVSGREHKPFVLLYLGHQDQLYLLKP